MRRNNYHRHWVFNKILLYTIWYQISIQTSACQNMKNIIALSLFCIPFIIQAAECSMDYFHQINEDRQKTSLQKKNALNNTCIGTTRIVTGVVVDVNSKTTIEIKAIDGFGYGLYLQANHNCGDVANLAKGQKITSKGKVKAVYGSILNMSLEDSVCMK